MISGGRQGSPNAQASCTSSQATAVAGIAGAVARRARQCRGAGPGLDAVEPDRQAAQGGSRVWSPHADAAAGTARGNRAGLRVPGIAPMLELHHGRNPADHRWIPGRLNWHFMNILDLLQWPAMVVTMIGSWYVASKRKHRRNWGYWLFLTSNVLWVAWGVHVRAYALVTLQLFL